jgi:NTE family protein
MSNTAPKKIGLCLSGGGARGFAHLGVLQAIDELKIPITQLSGSSAGAFAAALYSEGHSPQYILEQIVQRSIWQFVSFAPSKMGILKMTKTSNFLKQLIPHDSFEGLKIPISICATNISHGIPTYFNSGQLTNVLCASATVPIAFRPIIINGFKYLDGGLINNLPLEGLDNCNFKIAVNVTPFKKELPVKNMKDMVLKSLYISIDNQTKQRSLDSDLVIEPEGIMKFDGFRFRHADKLFQLGYDSSLKKLQKMGF